MKNILLFTLLSLTSHDVVAAAPKTLLEYRGMLPEPATLHDSVLVIIDAQREYVEGKLPLSAMSDAIKEAARLLGRARDAGTPIIHIVQGGRPGGALFAPDGPYAEFIPELRPRSNEIVITKTLPNAFAGTTLDQVLRNLSRKNLIMIGYMTHMCVSASVHAALDLSYHTTVVADACATRDLVGPDGQIVPAHIIHQTHLSGLADRFALVVQTQTQIAD